MKKFVKDNSLSIVFLLIFAGSLYAQFITGWHHHNEELTEKGIASLSKQAYFKSGHFIQATFENWESEFLQMFLFVVLTIFLIQKGSSESKDPQNENPSDRSPSPLRIDAPSPVRKGGIMLALYKHSLSIALLLLFIASFTLHFYGSLKDNNHEMILKGQPQATGWEYLRSSRFWFESFQNWQSEFLSVFCIVFLSIYLRQIGSPQSKPVDAPHYQTGE
ncbi:MAG: hypothetical protein JNL03_16915 [Prolixibacteraceae bacterium]|nr:hypothetical protein [Prolixibacteraceae bacterium]